MKRVLLTVICLILVLASIFGIYASYVGLGDVTDIKREKNEQHTALSEKLNSLSDALDEFEAGEEKNEQEEMDYATGVVTQNSGAQQKVNAGQAQYDSGKAQLEAGQAAYDKGLAEYQAGEAEYAAAQQKLEEGKAEYAAGQQKLEEGKAQLEAAKAERDAGQEKLNKATPAYNALKALDSVSSIAADAVAKTFGYGSASSVISEYEAGQAQLASANTQIANAEQEIANGEAELAAAKAKLDEGEKELAAARTTLDNGKAQLDASKGQLDAGRAKLNKAAAELAAGKKTVSENIGKMEEALPDLQEYKDKEEGIQASISALLANDDIAAKVEDFDDYRAVVNAAKEYLEDDVSNVDNELSLRQSLYNWLRILSVLGIIAGLVGIFAAFNPSAQKLAIALAGSIITCIGAIVLNILGVAKGYQYFVYTLPDGRGTGSLQNSAMIAFLIVSLAASVLAFVCYKSYRRALAPAEEVKKAPKKNNFVPDDFEPAEKPAPAPAKKPAPAPAEKPAPAPAAAAPAVDANDELEKARREYEEALRLFEETRKNMNK